MPRKMQRQKRLIPTCATTSCLDSTHYLVLNPRNAMAPNDSSRGNTHKPNIDLHRPEIVERTANGETLEQIAAALRAKGVDTTRKTISRHRLGWGLRKGPPHKFAGKKIAKPRPKNPKRLDAAQGLRKREIETRTRNGETAEQIAAALIAQGWKLSKGASTVLRLQTLWGLIDGNYKERKMDAKLPKVSKREQEREANREQQTSTLHYPTNCAFGPKRRGDGTISNEAGEMSIDYTTEPGPFPAAPPAPQQSNPAMSHNVAAEVMSVEILIDLATSTLSAAHGLKDVLLAYQGQRPSYNSNAGWPPTLSDLSNARKKVREAAGLMLDLAADPGV